MGAFSPQVGSPPEAPRFEEYGLLLINMKEIGKKG